MRPSDASPARRGVWLALLGPDGSGKSTVLARLERELRDEFTVVQRYHFRPHGGRLQRKGPVTDPHGERPRGWMASLAKLAYWWADHWTGYLREIRPAVGAGGLVLFDRCFDDVLVDPRRYRLAGLEGAARRVAGMIPRPDVIVVLDAPIEVLRARKREVPEAETARQRKAYLCLARRLPEGRIVDADRPVEEVVAEVCALVTRLAGASPGARSARRG